MDETDCIGLRYKPDVSLLTCSQHHHVPGILVGSLHLIITVSLVSIELEQEIFRGFIVTSPKRILKMSEFRVRKGLLLIKKVPIQMIKYFIQNKNEKQCNQVYRMQIKQWL